MGIKDLLCVNKTIELKYVLKKKVMRQYYLYNGGSYTGNRVSLYAFIWCLYIFAVLF